MPLGKLKKYVSEKRFGFITPDDGGQDIFAHSQQFNGYADGLRGGERVIFETEWDDAKQKYRAMTWSLDQSSTPVLKSGTIKVYFPEKGFGFIAPDEGGDNLFAHRREFIGENADWCKEGDRVKFDEAWDERAGKKKAAVWQMDTDGAGQGGSNAQFHNSGGYGPMGNNFGTPQSSPYGAGGMAGGKGGMGAPGGMPGGPSSLPPGWEQMPDPATGRMYYCNRSTGESSWTPPAAAPVPVTPAPGAAGGMSLPPGWEEAKDPSSGKSYYFNRSTGETKWDPPTPALPAPGAAGFMSLPPGWEEAKDPSSGKSYYFNRGTGETRWDRPQ